MQERVEEVLKASLKADDQCARKEPPMVLLGFSPYWAPAAILARFHLVRLHTVYKPQRKRAIMLILIRAWTMDTKLMSAIIGQDQPRFWTICI